MEAWTHGRFVRLVVGGCGRINSVADALEMGRGAFDQIAGDSRRGFRLLFCALSLGYAVPG